MSGSDQYRVVFKARDGHVECKDVLIDRGSASSETILAALHAQHEVSGVEVQRFYWVIPRPVKDSKVVRV